MMSLQESESSDPVFISAMVILRDRIGAMAAVHETLYSLGDFSRVPMDDYLERVVESLAVYGSLDRRVTLGVRRGDISLSLDQAIPCGLIAVELVTNSIKHAFTNRDSGSISLCLEKSGTDILLWVKDDGVWQERKAVEKSKQGTGSLIVAALASQLDGVFSIDSNTEGTRTQVVFPDKCPSPVDR
jgi:two-component sensor histidine kinase